MSHFFKVWSLMKVLKIFILLTVSTSSGCSFLQASKLLVPESFNLTPISPEIYVEVGTGKEIREQLLVAMDKAENAIRNAYGSVKSNPIVYACVTEDCYESFGGRGSKAKVYGKHILMSPRGLNWHYLAHEWSHSEILSRLTFSAWWDLPQWFNEGVAVVVSEAPEHSETHWQFLVASNISRPSQSELYELKSLRQWLDAVKYYDATKNAERRANGEREIRPLYTAAGIEVRPWLSKVGSQGLLALIESLNTGEAFESAYLAANKSINRNGAKRTYLPLTAGNVRLVQRGQFVR